MFSGAPEASAGPREDLARQGIELREGLVLTLYMDDADEQGRPDELHAQGVVHFNEDERCWVAAIDWSAIRHISDEESSGASGSNRVDPPLQTVSHGQP